MMAINDKLAKIRQRSASLNTKTGQLNETIDHINAQLLACNVGVTFWWDHNARPMAGPELCSRRSAADDRDTRTVSYFILGYTKVIDWGLAVQECQDTFLGGDFESTEYIDDPVPLRNASRAVRIAVADHLENFLDALAQAMEETEARVDRALALTAPSAKSDAPKKSALETALEAADPSPATKAAMQNAHDSLTSPAMKAAMQKAHESLTSPATKAAKAAMAALASPDLAATLARESSKRR